MGSSRGATTASKRKAVRVYADTSVYGGVHDARFAEPSRRFFDEVRGGRFDLVTSAVVQREVSKAPPQVVEVFDSMIDFSTIAEVCEDALHLREAYIAAGILTRKWAEDALHVALASVSGCSLVLSWNFKHIVHFEKIPKYNAVNALHGYPEVAIFAPMEVLSYEDGVH